MMEADTVVVALGPDHLAHLAVASFLRSCLHEYNVEGGNLQMLLYNRSEHSESHDDDAYFEPKVTELRYGSTRKDTYGDVESAIKMIANPTVSVVDAENNSLLAAAAPRHGSGGGAAASAAAGGQSAAAAAAAGGQSGGGAAAAASAN
jgi:hypothetical protein